MKLYHNFINFRSLSLASRPKWRLHTPTYVSNPNQYFKKGQFPPSSGGARVWAGI